MKELLARSDEEWFARRLQSMASVHSLTWLVAANATGVWMALLLLFPACQSGVFTYGRWAPLHLNWQLYGWCSMPAIGALLKRYSYPSSGALVMARAALYAWSFALAVGGVSWMLGESSGKVFLDWTGGARWVFVAALAFLWLVLAGNRIYAFLALPPRTIRLSGLLDAALLVVLCAVPVIVFWSSGRQVYPAFDPLTGGPVGASLLGSTLAIVLIVAVLPSALRLKSHTKIPRVFWGYFAGSVLLLVIAERASLSHRNPFQIAAMASLGGWIPLLAAYLLPLDWRPESRRWLCAVLGWWGALVVTGVVSFLPGVLDQIKFTNALVAHAHLAMAGFLTSLNFLILSNLSLDGPAIFPITRRGPFWTWNGALVLHLAALVWLAIEEVRSPGALFSGGGIGLYPLRCVAGIVMFAASLRWLAGEVLILKQWKRL